MKSYQPIWLTALLVLGLMLIAAGLIFSVHTVTISGAIIVLLWIIIQWLRIWFDYE